jgi:hypothetical protein
MKGISANFIGKPIVVMILLGLFTTHRLCSYDGDIFGGYDGSFSRYTFIQGASNIDLARGVLRNASGNNVRIDKLFSIGEDNVDEEDVQMLNDLESYIFTHYRIENGDAFSYFVKRGDTNNGADGWIVFSHYLNSSGWFHYLYYFSTY